jgi:hypothetical protein
VIPLNRDRITTFCELLGLFLVAFGAGLVYLPAGVVTAGAALFLVGFLGGRE